MKVPVSLVLSVVGGYVDTVGFLGLQGLFTAHVTGNFVTIGAALTQGSGGIVSKLLALPVFCLAVMATGFASRFFSRRGGLVLRRLLWAQVALLLAGAGLAATLHPFGSADGPDAILTGMVFVAAMAVQNAAHRVHLAETPPSTLMTGTTTQIMLDLSVLLGGGEVAPDARTRVRRMAVAVACFASGCAVGAVMYALAGRFAFAPPALAVLLAACAEMEGRADTRTPA